MRTLDQGSLLGVDSRPMPQVIISAPDVTPAVGTVRIFVSDPGVVMLMVEGHRAAPSTFSTVQFAAQVAQNKFTYKTRREVLTFGLSPAALRLVADWSRSL